jgi:hypothetical protein
MRMRATTAAALGLVLAAQPLSDVSAAVYAKKALLGQTPLIQRVQGNQPGGYPHHAPAWHGRPGPGPGPRRFPGWNGAPGWRGAAPWRGPAGWSGRPYWFGRPWVARPYYGTIIAGVALGTIA